MTVRVSMQDLTRGLEHVWGIDSKKKDETTPKDPLKEVKVYYEYQVTRCVQKNWFVIILTLLNVTKKLEEITLLLGMFMHYDYRWKYSEEALRLYRQSDQLLDTLSRFGVCGLKDKVIHKD